MAGGRLEEMGEGQGQGRAGRPQPHGSLLGATLLLHAQWLNQQTPVISPSVWPSGGFCQDSWVPRSVACLPHSGPSSVGGSGWTPCGWTPSVCWSVSEQGRVGLCRGQLLRNTEPRSPETGPETETERAQVRADRRAGPGFREPNLGSGLGSLCRLLCGHCCRPRPGQGRVHRAAGSMGALEGTKGRP